MMIGINRETNTAKVSGMDEKLAAFVVRQLEALHIPFEVEYDSSTDTYAVTELPIDKEEYLKKYPDFAWVFD